MVVPQCGDADPAVVNGARNALGVVQMAIPVTHSMGHMVPMAEFLIGARTATMFGIPTPR